MDPRPKLLGRLTGISARCLDQHLALLERARAELAEVEAAIPTVAWTHPPSAQSMPPGDLRRLLDTPVGLLPLSLSAGRLGDVLARLQAEVNSRGLAYWPGFYLGDDDFWTTDRATSVNVPWYLGSDATWDLVNDRRLKLSEDDVLRILRHEYAHALLYAYEGWKAPGWREAFGDFEAPYLDAYEPDPAVAADYVQNLGRPGPGQLAHYPQKHPDEDWAETFAAWLEGGWEDRYPPDTVAARKLRTVGRLVVDQGAFYGDPAVRSPGRRTPYQAQAGTLGEYLGAGRGTYSEHSSLIRRESYLRTQVTLHGLYFDALRPGTAPGPAFLAEAALAFGGLDGWAAAVRAAAGTTDGWALTVWDPGALRLRVSLVEADGAGVPPGFPVIAALDCAEHAWAPDYGAAGKYLGIAAWFRNLDWGVVDQRLVRDDGPFLRSMRDMGAAAGAVGERDADDGLSDRPHPVPRVARKDLRRAAAGG